MKLILTLLKPRLWAIRHLTDHGNKRGGYVKIAVFLLLGMIFWSVIFVVSCRVLHYFKGIAGLGDLLAFKLLSMVLITFLSLQIFSSILTFLSKLYLSRDLSLVHSMPVHSYRIFLARWIESTFDSTWMVIVYSLPVFIAFGIVFEAAWPYYAVTAASIVALSLIAAVLSSLFIMIVVVAVPASRIRGLFVFLGITVFLILFVAFRLLRPERLVDPETFASVLAYLQSLHPPGSPFLPSTWVFDGMKAALSGLFSKAFHHVAICWSAAATLILIDILVADALYFKGLSKSQTAPMRLFKFRRRSNRFLSFPPGPIRALTVKEVKTFFRDQTQWSQIFLIGALIIIYVYNFKALPLEKSPIHSIYLQNLLAFLNMGLSAFVLTAIAARFAYPAVSSEREAFWFIKSSPVSIHTFLWIKFCIYFLPLLILSEIIIVATNLMLNVTLFMMALSTLTVFFMVPGVVATGIGMGAAYADFKSENPAQTVTSFGGFLFMMYSAGFITIVIVLEAKPVYQLFMAQLRGRPLDLPEWIWIVGSFALVVFVCILMVVLPMRYGAARLRQMPR